MVTKQSDDGYIDVLEGIRRKTTVFGEKTLMSTFLLAGGSALPEHRHPYEQTGYLLSGHMVLRIGDEETEILRGDSWNIPADIMHGARVLEDSIALEVFCPAREDYMPDPKER